MKRVIRGSVMSSNNKPKNAVWVKDGQDMKWKIFKGTDNNTVDSNFLSRVNKQNHANYIDVIVVPNGKHPDEVINSSAQSSKDATFKTDKRLSPTSERYKGYLIVLDRGGDGYNVYDKHRELEDAGYPSREAAKQFIDELENPKNIISSVNDDDLIINKTYITLSDCFYDTLSNLHDADWDDVIEVFESNNWISEDELIIPKGTKMTLSEVNNYYNVFEVHTSYGKAYIPLRIEDCDGLFREVTDSEIYSSSHKSKSPYEVKHGITYTRSYSNDSGDQISIFVYDDDPDKQEYGEGGPSGDYFRGRWTQNMQDYYTSKGFKLDNTPKQNVSSAKAIDNTERRSQGVNRSATTSEYAVFKKTYSHSREFKDMDKQSGNIRDLKDELDNKGISYDIYYNKTNNGCTIFYDDDGTVTASSEMGPRKLTYLESELANKSNDKRKHSVTSSETFDAQSYAKQRKQSSEFNKWLKRVESAISRNDTTRIKNIKESLMYMTPSQLSNKLASYLIDKLNSALTTSSDDIKSASYGGAFDIEDDQFFTKDEIVEFGNTVCDHLNETLHDTYDVSDVYMETPKKLVLTVVQKSDESEFTATVDIDMRKIKKPADLMNRYLGDVVYALQQDIKAYNYEINASSDITAISSNDIIANTITHQLPPAVDMFLMDVAQIYGEFSYSDITKHRFSDSEIKQLQNLRRRYFKYVEVDDEDKIQSIIDKVNKIVLGGSLNASSDITSAQKAGVELIKTKVWNAIVAKLEDDGWEPDDISDYAFVEVTQDDDRIRVEVRAELSYKRLEELIESIDPIVQEYDNDAYFEPVEPGIAEAYIWNLSNINSSEAVEAGIYDVPDRPLDPPEDDSWEELDADDEVIKLTLDAIVHIYEDGSWEYEDTNYTWAASPDNTDGDWYTDKYSIYIGNKTSIVEYVDELLEPMMPAKEGKYHIKGDVTLVFSVEGIEVKRDYDEETYTDDAETSFLYDKSYIKNFKITER